MANTLLGAEPSTLELSVRESGSGTPLSGAAILLRQAPDYVETALSTDAAGICRLPLISARPPVVGVEVSKEGFVPRLISWDLGIPEFQLPQKFSLELERAQTIGGIVSDEQGAPIANVTLLITIRGSSFGRSQEIHNHIWEQKAVTDASGSWKFEGAPASLKYLGIRLIHPSYMQISRPLPPDSEFRAKTARLVMKKGGLIRGTVRDSQGKPLKDVLVLMNEHGSGSQTEPSFKTDGQGAFVIENAPNRSPGVMRGGVLLTFFKEGFAPELEYANSGPKGTPLNIVLKPGKRLAVRIVNQKGEPIPDVMIAPNHWRGVRPFGWYFSTNKEGRFEYKDAPEDEIQFDLLKQGYTALRDVPLRAGPETTLTMKAPLQVSGKVVDDATGNLIPTFQIQPGHIWDNGRKFVTSANSLTGKNGKFEWQFDEPVRRGTEPNSKRALFIRIEAKGYAIADSRPILESEDLPSVEIRLKRAEEIVIRVVNSEGQPVENAMVVLGGENNPIRVRDGWISEAKEWQHALTDKTGVAKLHALEENRPVVVVHKKLGFAETTLTEARTSDVKLILWGKVTAITTAIQKDGKPGLYLRYEALDARKPDDPWPIAYFDSPGAVVGESRVEFNYVKPGKARIGKFGRSDQKALEVEVRPGEETTIEIPAHEGIATVSGKLLLPDSVKGVNLSELSIGIYPTLKSLAPCQTWEEYLAWKQTPEGKLERLRWHQATPDSDGTFEIAEMSSGTYTLHAGIWTGKGKDLSYRGKFETELVIPFKEELLQKAGAPEGANFYLNMNVPSLPFYPVLKKGDLWPSFQPKDLAELPADQPAASRKVVVLFRSLIENYPALLEDLKKASENSKTLGVEIECWSVDPMLSITQRFLSDHPIPAKVLWIAGDAGWDNRLGINRFAGGVYAINTDGVVRGLFRSASDAVKAWEQPSDGKK